jgi:hypothetical protein
MSNKLTPLDKAKKIPVPEPGTGEFVIIPVEVLAAWMKLNHRKALGWYGSLLMTVPDVNTEENEEKATHE